jgi:hypothetical protein
MLLRGLLFGVASQQWTIVAGVGCGNRVARYLPFQTLPHRRDNLRARGHDAEKRSCAAIDRDVAIHRDLELAVSTVNHVHVRLKLTAKARRYTGGEYPGRNRG